MVDARNQKIAAIGFTIAGVMFIATENAVIGIVLVTLGIVFAARAKKSEGEA